MDYWLSLIGASEDVLPLARDFLVYIAGGSFFALFAMALLTLARAEGNARVGMIAMVIGATFSIALSALFILVFDMGLAGAGLATIISQCLSMIYLLTYYLNGNSYLKMRMKNLALDFKILKDMLSIGIAAFTQSITNSLSIMILINLVVSHGGDTALSAFGIAQRLMFFALMPGLVIGQGAQPILGYNYGAKRYPLLLKTINLAAVWSTIFSIVMFLILYLAPGPLIRIFTDDTELIDMAIYAAKLMFLSMPLTGTINLGTQMFQAIGKAFQAFATAVGRPLVFLIPLVYIMAHVWQLDGVFLAFPSADLLTFILLLCLVFPLIRHFRKEAAKAAHNDIIPESGQFAGPSEIKMSH
jgi:putative MATE family efflux protein